MILHSPRGDFWGHAVEDNVWLARKRGLRDGFSRFHGCLKMIARGACFASPTQTAQERAARFCAVSGLCFLRVASLVFFGGWGGGKGGGGGGGDDVHVRPAFFFSLCFLGFVCYMSENVAWAKDLHHSRVTRFAVVSFLWISMTKLT